MKVLLCLLLLSPATRGFAQDVRARITFDDSLSLATDGDKALVQKNWLFVEGGGQDCTNPPYHGTFYKDTLSETVGKLTMITRDDSSTKTYYVRRGDIYKVVFNDRAWYLIGNDFYEQDGSRESDPVLLIRFARDRGILTIIKRMYAPPPPPGASTAGQ